MALNSFYLNPTVVLLAEDGKRCRENQAWYEDLLLAARRALYGRVFAGVTLPARGRSEIIERAARSGAEAVLMSYIYPEGIAVELVRLSDEQVVWHCTRPITMTPRCGLLISHSQIAQSFYETLKDLSQQRLGWTGLGRTEADSRCG